MTPTSSPMTRPPGWRFRDVQLELSLKPFHDDRPETREAVCRELFAQWQPLLRWADQASVLLWVAEGSELLEFSGDLDDTFEWARYHGAPNRHRWELPAHAVSDDPDHSAIGVATGSRDPEGRGLHSRAYLYRPRPAVFTYRWLAGLVADLKRVGREVTGLPVHVGQAFDIGPEFAVSRFKFDWHREILSDGPLFKAQFISCEAELHADGRRYAAYAGGIPEGTPIGEFLGRQVRAWYACSGQDFLWLSNGFGFALEPWTMVGKVFDGETFLAERAAPTARRITRFWEQLRGGLGEHIGLRTRGTNLTTGIDLGSDGSPLDAIYRGSFGVETPVNSPWAALDGDFGLELSGWMSRISRTAGSGGYRFRFYLNDPWWLNRPWLDRYQRQPHDLYLPLAVSRVRADGSVEVPDSLAFLTVDDSHGQLLAASALEVTTFLLRARERAPDAAGPLVWLHPWAALHRWALAGGQPGRAWHADAWMGAMINAGVPLNTVVDPEVLAAALAAGGFEAAGKVVVTPVPDAGSAEEALVEALLAAGAGVMLVGPLPERSPWLRRLGLGLAALLEGDADLGDGRRVRHHGLISAGGWAEVVADPVPGLSRSRVGRLASGEERVVARSVVTGAHRGVLTWVRGSLATGEWDPQRPAALRGPILRPLREPDLVAPGELLKEALEAHGWELEAEVPRKGERRPYLMLHAHDGGWVASGYHRRASQWQRVRTPWGAPLRTGRHQWLRGGRVEWAGEVAWQDEVRVLVESGPDAELEVRELPPVMHGVHRRLLVAGLDGHRLAVLVPRAAEATLRLLPKPLFPYFQGTLLTPDWGDADGPRRVRTPPLSGELLIEW